MFSSIEIQNNVLITLNIWISIYMYISQQSLENFNVLIDTHLTNYTVITASINHSDSLKLYEKQKDGKIKNFVSKYIEYAIAVKEFINFSSNINNYNYDLLDEHSGLTFAINQFTKDEVEYILEFTNNKLLRLNSQLI